MTETKYLISNSPEVMMFNLQWEGLPTPDNILKILVSIPETFNILDLYTMSK